MQRDARPSGPAFSRRPRVTGTLLSAAWVALAITTGCSRDSSAAPQQHAAPSEAPPPPDSQGLAPAAPAAGPGASHVEGKNFKLDALLDGACQAKAECRLLVKLEAVGDFHINKDYPYKLKADASGVTFTGTDAAGPNVFSKAAGNFKIDDEKHATMTVTFKPASAGSVAFRGTYKMSVCSKDSCQLETQEVSMAIAVK